MHGGDRSRPEIAPLLLRLVLATSIVAALPAAMWFGWHLAPVLLGMEDPFTAVRRVGGLLPVVERPLVLAAEGMDRTPELLRSFVASVGLEEGHSLPSSHDFLVPLSWITAANPYTPLLGEYTDYPMSSVAFGYRGVDSRYHQATFYLGEADTTPSWLIAKVRGRATRWGDYFVHYTVLLSAPMNSAPDARRNTPQLDYVGWGSYAGGSYDGLEEILVVLVLAPVGWLLCIPLLVLAAVYVDRHYRAGSSTTRSCAASSTLDRE